MSDDEARAARDAGIASALGQSSPEWKAAVVEKAASIPEGWVGLYEEVHLHCVSRGVWQPPLPQCWSAMCNAMIKMGMFERVDDWEHPVSKRSHSSAYRKLRRT